jgi:hypothetical protein
MIEESPPLPPERVELLQRLRKRLPTLACPLEIVAEQVLGLDSRIDFVTRDPHGQVVLVLLAERGCDLAQLADSLAQCSWMQPRVADWLKIAPQLGLRPELGVRALLLAPELDPRTLAAARSLGDSRIELGICRQISNGAGVEILIDLQGAPLPVQTPVEKPAVSRFRTGLRPEDLAT